MNWERVLHINYSFASTKLCNGIIARNIITANKKINRILVSIGQYVVEQTPGLINEGGNWTYPQTLQNWWIIVTNKTWCLRTRLSVATVLNTHPYVPSNSGVNAL